jgi:hypothetical protein
MTTIAFERLELAIEAVRSTAEAAPTHRPRLVGTLTPLLEYAEGTAVPGILSEADRAEAVQKSSEWEAEGDADANLMPLWGVAAIDGSQTTGAQQAATIAYLWTFLRTMTADNLKSLDLWVGDPGLQMLLADYGMVDELALTADASGTDPVQMSVSGHAHFPADAATPTAPSLLTGAMLLPGLTSLWMDAGVSATIGTTAITGRLVSADITIPTGVTYKYLAQGATGTLEYARTGRERARPTLNLTFELLDMTQYDLFTAGSYVKTRIRFNAVPDSIVAGHNHYVEFDIFGKLRALSWGELEGSNRTVTFELPGMYDATAATDLVMRVKTTQSDLTP